jgi:hypothetical protein
MSKATDMNRWSFLYWLIGIAAAIGFTSLMIGPGFDASRGKAEVRVIEGEPFYCTWNERTDMFVRKIDNTFCVPLEGDAE